MHPYYPPKNSSQSIYDGIIQMMDSPTDYYAWALKNKNVIVDIKFSYMHGIERLHADRFAKFYKL